MSCGKKHSPIHMPQRARGGSRLSLFVLPAAAIAAVVVITASAVQLAGHEYVLTDGTRYETVRLYPGTVEQACEKAGFGGLDVYEQRESGGITYLTLGGELYAEISRGGSMTDVSFLPCTVEQLLAENGIELAENEIVTPALYTYLTQDTAVSISTVTSQTVTETEEIDFAVVTQENSTLEKGVRRIVRNGAKGLKQVTYSVVLRDGEEVERNMVSETVLKEPVDCIMERGTGTETQDRARPQMNEDEGIIRPSQGSDSAHTVQTGGSSTGLSTAGRDDVWSAPTGVTVNSSTRQITTADGTTYSYTDVLSVRATAYHRIEEGGLITASGTITQYGTVAVDPRVIPLGTRVFVVAEDGTSWSYGPGLAEDTGGLIKGNRIDLFFMTGDEAENFGVRNAKIYILSD